MGDFEAFYRRHAQLVFALARSRCADAQQAEDLAQDTFLRAWQHYGLLAGAAPLTQRAWLVRTLRNLAVDVWRRGCRVVAESLEAQPEAPAADGSAELRIDLTRALMALGETDRELVILRYLEGMNSREIGEVMGMPEGTVRRRLAESRRTMAGHLRAWSPAGEVR